MQTSSTFDAIVDIVRQRDTAAVRSTRAQYQGDTVTALKEAGKVIGLDLALARLRDAGEHVESAEYMVEQERQSAAEIRANTQ